MLFFETNYLVHSTSLEAMRPKLRERLTFVDFMFKYAASDRRCLRAASPAQASSTRRPYYISSEDMFIAQIIFRFTNFSGRNLLSYFLLAAEEKG